MIAIASAITKAKGSDNYKALVFIDGLERSQERIVGSGLRRIGIKIEHVRGVRDESDSIIRLVDALAGLILANEQGDIYAQELYKTGTRKGYLQDALR